MVDRVRQAWLRRRAARERAQVTRLARALTNAELVRVEARASAEGHTSPELDAELRRRGLR